MQFDIDPAVAAADDMVPWNFQIVTGGVAYPTVRPTVGDIGSLLSLKVVNDAELRDRIGRLFADPRPDLGEWDGLRLGAALTAYLAYYGECVKKKSKIVADKVAAAVPVDVAKAVALDWAAVAAAGGPTPVSGP